MRTIVIKIDLDGASSIAQDFGDLSWDRTQEIMRDLASEIRFFHKRAAKPRAIRIGNVRIVLAGFFDTKERINLQRDEPANVEDDDG